MSGMCSEAADALSSIKIADGFWAERMETNRSVTLPHCFTRCEESAHLTHFDQAAGVGDGEYQGSAADDSDVYKIIEGAAHSLCVHPDPELETYTNGLVDRIVAAQEQDGYLSTSFTVKAPDRKWADLHKAHELYCAGHFFEAAVAHEQATGQGKMLDAAIRLADHIDSVFGPDRRHGVPGHQEIELALIKLYTRTGEKRYLDLCRFFLDQRGTRERLQAEYAGKEIQGPEHGPDRNRPPEYGQDHRPVAEQQQAVGHAVRACYLYAGMADVARLTGSTAYNKALDAIWHDIADRKLYLTGSVGSAQYDDEGFGEAYRLPNEKAYCETCASVAHLLWNHRMGLLRADARYADMVERVLFNGFLAGTSLSGDRFFYRNPLASDGSSRRRPWFEPACCPSNVVRIFPQLPRFIYAVGDEAVYVNLFVGSTGLLRVGDRPIRLTQRTRYPWDGKVEIVVEPGEASFRGSINIRIPGWSLESPVAGDLYRCAPGAAARPELKVNGEAFDLSRLHRGYAAIHRTWQKGDTITLDLPMPARRVYAHPKVEADHGRVALMRGPLVYCLEADDHETDVREIVLPEDAALVPEHREELLGGVTVICAKGEAGEGAPADLTAVPYYAWNNRSEASMAVWIQEKVHGRDEPVSCEC